MKLGKNLNGHLSKNVYMEQLDGFQVNGKGHMMCKLKRSIYWLNQASRSVGANIFFLCFMWMIYCFQQMIMSSCLKRSVCCLPIFSFEIPW
jgi:hypothetical protein